MNKDKTITFEAVLIEFLKSETEQTVNNLVFHKGSFLDNFVTFFAFLALINPMIQLYIVFLEI